MNAECEMIDIPDDLSEAVRFHGHLCPGLVIGYVAARAGMEAIGVDRSEDEELIAIVENDSCAVDAVQLLTGCTFGKGNFFFRDYGKQVYTFAVRPSGNAVRVSLKPDAGKRPDDESLPQEKQRAERIKALLAADPKEIFNVREVEIDMPEKAQIYESTVCEMCGEKAMETRLRSINGRKVCIPCAEGRNPA